MTHEEITIRIRQIVLDHIKETTGETYPADELRLDTILGQDLAFDSLDNIELEMALEDAFDIEVPDADVENFTTFGSVVDCIARRLAVAA